MFCNCFVHISPFCCDDNILVLTAKGQMSKYHLMFISAIIGKCKPQYGYGKQYRIGSLEKHYITLPTLDSKINFSFMESFCAKSIKVWLVKTSFVLVLNIESCILRFLQNSSYSSKLKLTPPPH